MILWEQRDHLTDERLIRLPFGEALQNTGELGE